MILSDSHVVSHKGETNMRTMLNFFFYVGLLGAGMLSYTYGIGVGLATFGDLGQLHAIALNSLPKR